MQRVNNELPEDDVLFEIPSFKNASIYIQFGRSGKLGVRSKASILDQAKTMDAADLEVYPTSVYSLPIKVGSKQSITLPLGLIPLTGETKAGKSNFVKSLSKLISMRRVIAVEPADADELMSVPIFESMDLALAYLVKNDLQARKEKKPSPLMVLDSLREGLFEIVGSAGAKGIINAFFTANTRVSNALAMNGFTMVGVVNPMNLDSDYLKEFMSKLDSSVTGFLKLSTRLETTENVNFTGTISMRPVRDEKAFSASVSKGKNKQTLAQESEVIEFVAHKATLAPDLYTGVASNILNNVGPQTEGAI